MHKILYIYSSQHFPTKITIQVTKLINTRREKNKTIRITQNSQMTSATWGEFTYSIVTPPASPGKLYFCLFYSCLYYCSPSCFFLLFHLPWLIPLGQLFCVFWREHREGRARKSPAILSCLSSPFKTVRQSRACQWANCWIAVSSQVKSRGAGPAPNLVKEVYTLEGFPFFPNEEK